MNEPRQSLLKSLAHELARVLDPVTLAIESPEAMEGLLGRLGVFNAAAAGPAAGFAALLDLKTQIEALAAQDDLDFDAAQTALEAARSVFTLADAIDDVGGAGGAMKDLGRDLVDLLLETWLAVRHPVAREVLALLTLLESGPDRPQRPPVVAEGLTPRAPIKIDRLRLDRLPALLRDPVGVLKEKYVNALATEADAAAMAGRLFPQVVRLLRALGVSCRYGMRPEDEPQLGNAAALMRHALIIYAVDPLVNGEAEAGVVLALSPAGAGDLGLVVSPFGALTFSKAFERWLFESTIAGQVDVLAWGRHGPTLLAQAADAQVTADLVARTVPPGAGPAYVFGAADGTRLELGSVELAAGTSVTAASQSLKVSADVKAAALVIAPGDGDGFLSSILPKDGLQAKFDLGLEWSNERGLTFRGAGSLEATLPVGLSVLDVLTVPVIHLRLGASEAGVQAEVSADVGLSLGPVKAAIERLGIATALTFPEHGGNLGPVDLDIFFKPPTGVGVSIETAVVVGGGFLRFDPEKGEYGGILQLEIAGRISVKAIGLLSTRMPDGSKGYSLIVIITAEGFPPIQLGYGFVLTGIGGLLGINRTFDEEALRAGLKNHALDSVMFPQDPIRNAPQILSNLNKLFPPASGHHLFGPMVQISWGTPALITGDLAVVLEFGERLRLLILGQVAAVLPTQENDVIRLHLDSIGLIDFDQGHASLDASLYDSRLLKKFTLSGDMAMRMNWEGTPNFALAVGGLHPAFNPPANFPKLARIAIDLSSGDNPRLRCEAYFALTANTVQFGARAELYASAAGFSIHGQIGFDVLIQFDPFEFLAEFYAQLQLKRGSRSLFNVKVEGALAGPRPLRVKAKATFEILWWDYSVRVDKTLVGGEKPPAPEPIDVWPRLKEALELPGNWLGQLPAGERPMVTLRDKPRAETDVPLHPLGTLTVKQGVVPLDLDISKFGQAAPAGARRFTISSVRLGELNQTTRPVTEFFAPAQFLEMSDAEKLSRDSFEAMAAGVSFGSEEYAFTSDENDWLEVEAIKFETIIMNKEKGESRHTDPATLYQLTPKQLGQQARFGAAGGAEIRRSGKTKYRAAVGKYQITKEGYSLVATESLSVEPMPGIEKDKPVNYSEAVQALRHLKLNDPTKAAGLRIMRLSEMAAP